MAQQAEQLDVEEVPVGGIGDFIMSDEDFSTLERQNARQEFGDQGLANFEDIANKMAAYGRFGDDKVVHVETGELVVPRRLIEQSPELKESIFQHLREAGIEDPERYVVGNSENSFNPETGLREFGFFSKLWKGIKKAVKKVGKVLKKFAPIILAIAMPYMLPAMGFAGVGAAYATALGSGVGTLIQGGNIGDALKSAAIAGVSAAVVKGVGSKMQGDTFGEGFTGAFEAPVVNAAPISESVGTMNTGAAGIVTDATASGSINAATSGAGLSLDLGSTTLVDGSIGFPTVANPAAATLSSAANAGSLDLGATTLVDGSIGFPTVDNPAATLNQSFNPESVDIKSAIGDKYQGFNPESVDIQAAIGNKYVDPAVAAGGVDTATSAGTIADATRGSANTFLGNLGEAGGDLFRGEFGGFGTNLKEAFMPNFQVNSAIKAYNKTGGTTAWGDLSDLAKEPFLREAAAAGTSMLSKIGGYAPLALGAASAGGFFDVPEQEEVGILGRDEFGNLVTGADLLAQDPYKYSLFAGTDPRGYLGGTTTGSNYNPYYTEVPADDPVYGADGGGVFPRRIGGIMPSEGIANEDSVKAMLMPGEFVMTTDAVKGFGNGNAEQGIKNMYTVMRNLERRGGAMG